VGRSTISVPTPFDTSRGSRRTVTDLFARFRETTDEIARLQSKFREGRDSSHRIRRLYRKRTRRRDHAQEALVHDSIERLYAEGVATVYVGDLTNVLETHWSAEVNQKTHQFWAFRAFVDRLSWTAEEYGITVEAQSEAFTTAECSACGEREETERDGDLFRCPCGYEGHADLDAPRTFLEQQAGENRIEAGPMARPVRLTWDDHCWSAIRLSREGTSQRGAHKPEYRRRETCLRGCGITNIPTGGIPRRWPWEDVESRTGVSRDSMGGYCGSMYLIVNTTHNRPATPSPRPQYYT